MVITEGVLGRLAMFSDLILNGRITEPKKERLSMKKFTAISILVLAPVLLVKAAAPDGGAINDDERAFLVQQLEKTKKDFLASIAGLSEAQWKFKPAGERVERRRVCRAHRVGGRFYFQRRSRNSESACYSTPKYGNA
jgi:hypothetical protein